MPSPQARFCADFGQGVSKRQLKKAAKNALKPKKEKDPNW